MYNIFVEVAINRKRKRQEDRQTEAIRKSSARKKTIKTVTVYWLWPEIAAMKYVKMKLLLNIFWNVLYLLNDFLTLWHKTKSVWRKIKEKKWQNVDRFVLLSDQARTHKQIGKESTRTQKQTNFCTERNTRAERKYLTVSDQHFEQWILKTKIHKKVKKQEKGITSHVC